MADVLGGIAKHAETYTRYRINAWERSKTFAWPVILPQMVEWLEAHAEPQ